LHVAIDFLPRCGWQHGLRPVVADDCKLQNKGKERQAFGRRWQAISSTLLGGVVVATAWALL
jgi:ZIP family zinc transporter